MGLSFQFDGIFFVGRVVCNGSDFAEPQSMANPETRPDPNFIVSRIKGSIDEIASAISFAF
jgi:hypothetical protein